MGDFPANSLGERVLVRVWHIEPSPDVVIVRPIWFYRPSRLRRGCPVVCRARDGAAGTRRAAAEGGHMACAPRYQISQTKRWPAVTWNWTTTSMTRC